jgi:hypothetical protein
VQKPCWLQKRNSFANNAISRAARLLWIALENWSNKCCWIFFFFFVFFFVVVVFFISSHSFALGIRREIFIYLFIYLSPKQHGQGNFFGQFFQKKLVTFGGFKILKKFWNYQYFLRIWADFYLFLAFFFWKITIFLANSSMGLPTC